MAEGKNQHYVPQRYFRMFSQDGKSIRVLKLSNGQIISNAPIKGQASKSWFYGDSQVEGRLAQVEHTLGDSLKEIAACKNIKELNFNVLEKFFMWLTVQRVRTESSRAASRDNYNEMIRLWCEANVNSRTDLSEKERNLMRSIIPRIEGVDSTIQLTKMKIAAESSTYLSDLGIILVNNTSNKPFVFSDAPCIYYNMLRSEVSYKGVLGLKSLGLMVIFPLNEKLLVILYDKLSYNVRCNANGVRSTNFAPDISSLNSLQLHSASNCIYFNNKSDDNYIKYLWNKEKDNFSSSKYISKESTPKMRSDGTSSSIYMTFEPQLPIKINLSFLSPKAIQFPSEINTRDDYLNYISHKSPQSAAAAH